MPGRSSRSRSQTSQGLPRIDTSSCYVRGCGQEVVFCVCEAHAFSRKTLKSKDHLSQELVEHFVRKGPRTRPNHYQLFLLEDRIRFKPRHVGLRNFSHPTVPYKEIKGAFTVVERPHWIVLGIHYPRKNQSKLEAFHFPRTEDADRLKELLLKVRDNEECLIQGVEPIGMVASGSTRSLSRPSSLVDYETTEPDSRISSANSAQSEPLKRRELSPRNGKVDNFSSRATSPITDRMVIRELQNGTKNSGIIRYVETNGHVEHEPPVEVFKLHPVSKQPPRTLINEYEEQPVQQTARMNHWKGYEDEDQLTPYSNHALFALADEVPGSLIFINNTPSKGIHVSDDGPVYMFCQFEQ